MSGHARSGLAALSRAGNMTRRIVPANSYTQEMEMSQEMITCVPHYLATFFLLLSLSGNYDVACLPVPCSNWKTECETMELSVSLFSNT